MAETNRVFMIGTFELAMRANLVNPPRLSTFAMWVLLVLCGVYTLGWLIRLLLRVSKAGIIACPGGRSPEL